MLSKSEKAQLIEIERCEHASKKEKLIEQLNTKRTKIEEPFNTQIKKLEDEKNKALIDAGLFYISSGCGKNHPDIEAFNIETNNAIKAILRE